MRLIRNTLKPRRPLLETVTSQDRQAGRLQKAASALSGLLLVCILSLAAPLVAGELEEYPEVGPTPLLALKDLGGNPHRLDDYRGQVVLLNFWATWCPPCLIEMPSMQRLKQALAETPFSILAVNSKESKGKVWRFQRMLDVHFAVLLDTTGQAAEDWYVAVYPTSYLIDGTGRIRYMAYGALDWDSKEVIELIKELSNEPPP
jgi:thiol-disulfide isomerase/thioredoxin